MKEVPILYSTDMVKATLANRKRKTRRMRGLKVLNLSPDSFEFLAQIHPSHKQKPQPVFRFKRKPGALASDLIDVQCPYGQAGDLLWVRESWAPKSISEEPPGDLAHYRASDEFACDKWKPSIHMKKEVARIWLEIVSVKVERLQEITEEDAIAEGVLFYDDKILGRRYKDYEADASAYGHPDHDYPTVGTARESFFTLWQSINGEGSWNANPWVWVVEYKNL